MTCHVHQRDMLLKLSLGLAEKLRYASGRDHVAAAWNHLHVQGTSTSLVFPIGWQDDTPLGDGLAVWSIFTN